jgi:hypothetical protein
VKCATQNDPPGVAPRQKPATLSSASLHIEFGRDDHRVVDVFPAAEKDMVRAMLSVPFVAFVIS